MNGGECRDLTRHASETFRRREFDATELKHDPKDDQSLHSEVLERLQEKKLRGKPNYSYK